MSNPFLATGESQSTSTPVPPGMLPAVIVGLYDVGWQYDEKFDKSNKKVIFAFEFPTLPHLKGETKEGKPYDLPRILTKKYTNNLGEKANLRKDLQSWATKPLSPEQIKGLDLTTLIGRPLNVLVVDSPKKDGSPGSKVETLLPLGQTPKPVATTKPFMHSVSTLKSPAELEALDIPKWIKDQMMTSDEWKKMIGKASKAAEATKTQAAATGSPGAFDVPVADPDDDVPF